MLSSVRSANHGSTKAASDIPPPYQSLSLEQIMFGYQKYAHSVVLRKILGFPFEDHHFGVSHENVSFPCQRGSWNCLRIVCKTPWKAPDQISRELIIVEKYRGMLKGGYDILNEEKISTLPDKGCG